MIRKSKSSDIINKIIRAGNPVIWIPGYIFQYYECLSCYLITGVELIVLALFLDELVMCTSLDYAALL